jgi:Nuclease-related domain
VDGALRKLRYETHCSGCRRSLAAGSLGAWSRELRQATCADCIGGGESRPIDRGQPGRSAVRRYERLRDNRERAIRDAHPRLGNLILAVTDDPQSTRAWARGAAGEQALGGRLEEMRGDALGVLHDRRIPGSRANIDHIAVAPSGIYVIDPKRYAGRVESRDRGSFFRSDLRLYVRGRDRSKLVLGMDAQIDAVRAAVRAEVPIIPVLCFIESDWGFFPKAMRFGNVLVVWPTKLYELLRQPGPLDGAEIARLERHLAEQLPAA